MIYPQFIKDKNTIGVCAPSAGIGSKIDRYIKAKKFFNSNNIKVVETAHVRVDNERSCSAKQRAKELDELIINPKVDAVIAAAGGDYMLEMMPYINFEHIKENPKWLHGMSDPTNLLYTVTTKLDIATLYGHNFVQYGDGTKDLQVGIDYLKGKIKKQKAFKIYHDYKGEGIDKKVNYIYSKDVNINGRLIGGCLDVIEKLIGTKYDYTNDFIDRYKDDGIIWYFDIFAMSSYNFYLTLLQLKQAGYFRYCKGVLIGRVAFETIENKKLDYIKAADKALGNIPHILEMDIGHTDYPWVMINGAICNVICNSDKKEITFKLK